MAMGGGKIVSSISKIANNLKLCTSVLPSLKKQRLKYKKQRAIEPYYRDTILLNTNNLNDLNSRDFVNGNYIFYYPETKRLLISR